MRLILSPAIWLTHFSVVYLLLTFVCASSTASRNFMGMNAFILGIAIASVVALGAIGAVAHSARRDRDHSDAERSFSARVSVVLAMLSAVAVVWVAYPAFVLPACES